MTSAGITLVPVPGGLSTITDRRTQARWDVEVAGFALASTTTTIGQYRRVCAQAASPHGDETKPVTDVSWHDAIVFCNQLSRREGLDPVYDTDGDEVRWNAGRSGYRLPTEAEWEHACRAGTSGPHYGELADIAWYRDNAGGSAQPVATKSPNAWQLFDMLGNVFEWCWDLYDPAVYGTYRVLKGGGWADPHWSCRVGVRRRSMTSLRIDDVGFRVARSVGTPGLD